MKPVKILGQRLSVFICTIKRSRIVTVNGNLENDCDEIKALLSLNIDSDRIPRLVPTTIISESFQDYPITGAITYYLTKPNESDVGNKLAEAFSDESGSMGDSFINFCESVALSTSDKVIFVAYLIDESDVKINSVGKAILPLSLTEINAINPLVTRGCRIKIPQISMSENGITLYHPVFPDDELGFIRLALEHFEVQSRNRRRAAATALENIRF